MTMTTLGKVRTQAVFGLVAAFLTLFNPVAQRSCSAAAFDSKASESISAADHDESSFEQLARTGAITCALQGDGESTSECTMKITNNTATDIALTVPAGQCLNPAEKNIQVMVTTGDTPVNVPAKQTISTVLATLCGSAMNVPPPPARMIGCTPMAHPNQQCNSIIKATVAASQQLSRQGSFDKAMIAHDRRSSTITQLAVWHQIGLQTKTPDDDVTESVIRRKLIDGAGLQENTLTKDQKKELTQSTTSIFEAVNLTSKHAKILLANVDLTRKKVGSTSDDRLSNQSARG